MQRTVVNALAFVFFFIQCHRFNASKNLQQLLAEDDGSTAPSTYFSELLLGGLHISSFLSNNWEQRPLHVENDPTHFDGLLTEADIYKVVEANPSFVASASRARFAQRGFDNASAVALKDIDRLATYLSSGHTAVIDSFEMLWPPARYVVNAIENALKIETQANLYFTPANSTPAFRVHFDTQDIFVIQLCGRKRWDVFEPMTKLPTALHTPDQWDDYESLLRRWLKRKRKKSQRKKKVGPTSYTLKVGHVLFIPRGHAHDVVSVSERDPSIHLSLSIKTADRSLWVHALGDLLDAYIHINPLMQQYPQFLAAMRSAMDSFVRKAPLSLRSSRFPRYYGHTITAPGQAGLFAPAPDQDELIARYDSLMTSFIATATTTGRDGAALGEALSILQTAAPSLWHAVHERPKLFLVAFQRAWPSPGSALLSAGSSEESMEEKEGECTQRALFVGAPKVASILLDAPLFAPFLKASDRKKLEAGKHCMLLVAPTSAPSVPIFTENASPFRVASKDVNYLLLPTTVREAVKVALRASGNEPVGPDQLPGVSEEEATQLLQQLLQSRALSRSQRMTGGAVL
jgi:hypothetical protein